MRKSTDFPTWLSQPEVRRKDESKKDFLSSIVIDSQRARSSFFFMPLNSTELFSFTSFLHTSFLHLSSQRSPINCLTWLIMYTNLRRFGLSLKAKKCSCTVQGAFAASARRHCCKAKSGTRSAAASSYREGSRNTCRSIPTAGFGEARISCSTNAR